MPSNCPSHSKVCARAVTTEKPRTETLAKGIVFAIASALAVATAACAPTYVVEPANGAAYTTSATEGLTLVVQPNAWAYDPWDLGEYLTPIWIRITNRRPNDVRIVYADFALTDEAGFRYAVISPYSGGPISPGSSSSAPASDKSRIAETSDLNMRTDAYYAMLPPEAFKPIDAISLANFQQTNANPEERTTSAPFQLTRGGTTRLHGGGGLGGRFGGGRYGGYGHYGGRPVPGFYVHPYGYGAYPFFSPWPYGYYGLGYYGPYAYRWDYRYYPASPSYDVVQYGLPQGGLKTGGTVAGFVYFQRATTRATRLTFTWTAHAADGKTISQIVVPLNVVKD